MDISRETPLSLLADMLNHSVICKFETGPAVYGMLDKFDLIGVDDDGNKLKDAVIRAHLSFETEILFNGKLIKGLIVDPDKLTRVDTLNTQGKIVNTILKFEYKNQSKNKGYVND